MAGWQLIEDARLDLIDDAEGDRIAEKLQEEWDKQYPHGIKGKRCIFKWDEGKFYFADIPVDTAQHRKTVPQLNRTEIESGGRVARRPQ